ISAEQQQQRAIMMEQMNLRRPTAGKFSNNAASPLFRNQAASYFRSTYFVLVFFGLICSLQPESAAAAQAGPGAMVGASEAFALYRNLRTVGLDTSKVYKIRDAEFDLEDMHFAL